MNKPLNIEYRLNELQALSVGWDSYGGLPLTDEAAETLRRINIVPSSDGGAQIEMHVGGADIEIEVEPDGQILGISFDRVHANHTGEQWVVVDPHGRVVPTTNDSSEEMAQWNFGIGNTKHRSWDEAEADGYRCVSMREVE